MQQLSLDLPSFPLQLSHMGWTAHFREQDGEVVYTLITPQGRQYSESFTGLPMSKLSQARRDAKEAIAVMESAPPFVMSPQPSKKGADTSTPLIEKAHDSSIIQQPEVNKE